MNDQERHTFRVRRGCSHEEYITADYLAVSQVGIVQLVNHDSHQPVAVIIGEPGLSVVRVDTLITQEGLA